MTPTREGKPAPGSAEVRAIAALGDVVIRNLKITDCYARLAQVARARLGDGANWYSFAVWASRQAGCTIRGEDFGDRLADLARQRWTPLHPIRGLWRVLLRRGLFNPSTKLGRLARAIHSPFDAFERASDAVAAGNVKVFGEIGYEMARYLETCGGDPFPDSPVFSQFRDGLAPGPPPCGQEFLRRAFLHYQRLRLEPHPARRAQLMLLANLEIGLHEQTRLQPEIQRAMEAGPDTAEDLGARLLPWMRKAWVLRAVAAAARPYRRFARELTRRAISEALMVIRMPDRVVALGRNLECPTPEIFAAWQEPELAELVSSLEPYGAACADCGVEDWADLRQRMHYIFHLFRALHENTALFDPPFTAAQVEAVQAGRVPPGRL